MAKNLSASNLRSLNDAELALREREVAETIMRNRFASALSRATFNSAVNKGLKKERARLLTIQRERQLALDGIAAALKSQTRFHEAQTLKVPLADEEFYIPQAPQKQRVPVMDDLT